ncbi:Crp/Fnr family transcriptional regulator [Synechococcus elongatus]|uniref:Crp/Fnr family transcriptional regulator n=1 Tax=Synechococcus elongatus PCC 11801 TaxID=2219813 RepID=A0AAN1UU59_SYNEL|nr:Crp/Fnr family transcriptional regulator [Synechococcus elongatus]AZB72233.1 Crp/Fnr family transcriptional regulator [Synechococcus elongatus PCC 11801]
MIASHLTPKKAAIANSKVVPLRSATAGIQVWSRNTSLPTQSTWCIQTGFVRSLTWDEAGELITLGIWGPGDWIGGSLSRLQPYELQCLTPVTATAIADPLDNLDSTLVLQLQQVEELLSIIRLRRVPSRLLRLLHWLTLRFGLQAEHGWMLDLHLTHQVLADIIGSTRVTITKLINQFEAEGRLIRLSGQRLLVPDLTQLLPIDPVEI